DQLHIGLDQATMAALQLVDQLPGGAHPVGWIGGIDRAALRRLRKAPHVIDAAQQVAHLFRVRWAHRQTVSGAGLRGLGRTGGGSLGARATPGGGCGAATVRSIVYTGSVKSRTAAAT